MDDVYTNKDVLQDALILHALGNEYQYKVYKFIRSKWEIKCVYELC